MLGDEQVTSHNFPIFVFPQDHKVQNNISGEKAEDHPFKRLKDVVVWWHSKRSIEGRSNARVDDS
jgi:hypothetical protein